MFTRRRFSASRPESGAPLLHRHARRVVLLTMAVVVIANSSSVRAQRDAPKGRDGKVPVSGTTIAPSASKVKVVEFARIAQPLAATQRPGDDALYVVSKTGRITVWRDGGFDPAPVLDISNRVDSTNERGLLGLAFSPKRAGLLYIDYTDKKGVVHVSEIPFDGKIADVSKERVLLRIPKPFNEHNAGTILFDNDDNLLIAIGDGGGSGDQFNNGQRTDTFLGKILRINPSSSGTEPYTVPADNPFVNQGALTNRVKPEIIAYGLRNPWRISIDRATGDLWVPDVGQSNSEEVNRLARSRWGANFGWRLREGDRKLSGGNPKGYVEPVYAYPHLDGRCAIVGGHLYRGKNLPWLTGTYIFGDVCTGKIAALRLQGGKWKPEDLGAQVPYLAAFGLTSEAEMIAISLEGGLYRVEAA